MSAESTFITRVFDITTGHMTKEDAEALEHDANEGSAPVCMLGDYGYLVYAGDPDINWPEGRMSKAFREVMLWAGKLDCSYVRFDRDGEAYPGLEVFEW